MNRKAVVFLFRHTHPSVLLHSVVATGAFAGNVTGSNPRDGCSPDAPTAVPNVPRPIRCGGSKQSRHTADAATDLVCKSESAPDAIADNSFRWQNDSDTFAQSNGRISAPVLCYRRTPTPRDHDDHAHPGGCDT